MVEILAGIRRARPPGLRIGDSARAGQRELLSLGAAAIDVGGELALELGPPDRSAVRRAVGWVRIGLRTAAATPIAVTRIVAAETTMAKRGHGEPEHDAGKPDQHDDQRHVPDPARRGLCTRAMDARQGNG